MALKSVLVLLPRVLTIPPPQDMELFYSNFLITEWTSIRKPLLSSGTSTITLGDRKAKACLHLNNEKIKLSTSDISIHLATSKDYPSNNRENEEQVKYMKASNSL